MDSFRFTFPEVNNQLQSVLIKKCKKNQIQFNYGIIKAFKASNKAVVAMSDYK